jgi:phosphatidylglycerol lysyltransferase
MKRRWILWLLALGFAWVMFSRYAQIQDLAQTLSTGAWQWVIVAALLQVVYYIIYAASYQAAFHTVEVKSKVLELIPVTLGSLFINVIVPVTGMAGVVLFVDDAGRRGESPSRAAAGSLLQLAANFLALSLILIVGMVYLWFQGNLKAYEVIAALILLAIVALWSTVLGLGAWKPQALQRLFAWAQRTANRLAGLFKRPPYLGDEWAAKNAAEFTDASQAIARHPRRLAVTFAILMLAHAVALASLYTLFLAFHTPVSIGVLIAGYSVGILFSIVSPTPQGIGVVEGIMPLVFGSLAVSGAVAATVSLGFRGLSFWIPLFLGFLLIRRTRSFSPEERALTIDWGVRLVAILTGVMGVINLLSAVMPPMDNRVAMLEQYSPLVVRQGSNLAAVLAGFTLLLLAGGLWRHKRIAWWLAILVLGISILTDLAKGLDYEEAVIAGLLLAALLLMRNSFNARSDPPSLRGGVLVLAATVAFTLLYGAVGFYLLHGQFAVTYSFLEAIRQTVVMFTNSGNTGLQPVTTYGSYFASSIYLVGALTVGAASLLLLRPVILRRTSAEQDRRRAQSIVSEYGCSSLARLALFSDKARYFSPGGSMVSFAVQNRVAVALGDPIGPPEDFVAAITGFVTHCVRNDWQPAFYQTQPDGLEAYTSAGFKTMCIGQEAIVNLHSRPLIDAGLLAITQPMLAQGFRAEVLQPPIPDLTLTAIRAVSDEWLTSTRSGERQFSLAWFDDDYLISSSLILLRDPRSAIFAFANLNLEYQRKEVSFDLVRHTRYLPGGTMEFLVVSMIQWAQAEGYDTFNLGLSALAGVGETPGDPSMERVLHYAYDHVSLLHNFRGQYEFKQRFNPTWSPRYLAYPSTPSLPAVWIAITRLDAGAVLGFDLPVLQRVKRTSKQAGQVH